MKFQRLRPLDEKHCVIVGRARTFRWLDTDYVVEENPYGKEIEAMDSLGEGDVAVHSTDSGGTNAPWGELMSTAAKMRGAVGCICDSQIRDCLRRGDVLVNPQDLIFADFDGVVVIPKEVEDQVLELAKRGGW